MAKKSAKLDGIQFPSFSKNEPTIIAEKKGGGLRYVMDPDEKASQANDNDSPPSLVKSIVNILNGPRDSVERLAFEVDPSLNNTYSSLYQQKQRLIPDSLLKRIAIQDDLVAAIVQARSNHLASFGRPRPDRHSTGFVIEPNPGVVDNMTPEEKKELDARVKRAVDMFRTCGNNKGWSDEDRCSFSKWLLMSTRNAVVVGRIATEIIYAQDAKNDGERKFHSFRAIDAGTIYRAAPQKQAGDSVRRQAKQLLEQLKNAKFTPEKYQQDEYAWIQVIDGRPVQAFTAKECVVHNFYPVADVELNGYPVTPIDTMITAVTTHINITTHNKLYFQSGRATRGMLLIKSDDVDEGVISKVKQQFNASINNVNNSWRMPVFAVGTGDDITWQSIDGAGSRDMEFQYLTDMNARIILSAFQMSPEELPGWSYLSRGTNNQALSEGNNEYKLEAARDLGIRPLISQFEDYINDTLFPLIDENLAKIAKVKLVGLDADSPEKESVRLQQDIPVHMTYDQVMQKVEKRPLGKAMGGDFPLNPQYGEVADKYLTVGQILEFFFGVENASKDPELAYRRDSFWFQFQELKAAAQQAQQQAQAQAQQAQQPGGGQPNSENPEASGVSDTDQPGGAMDAETEKQKSDKATDASAPADTGQDLSRAIDQALSVLTKSESQLPPSKRRILAQHKKVIKQAFGDWDEELRQATKEIVAIAEHHTPKKRQ